MQWKCAPSPAPSRRRRRYLTLLHMMLRASPDNKTGIILRSLDARFTIFCFVFDIVFLF